MNPLSITGCAGWIECGVDRCQAECEAVTVSEGHVVLCSSSFAGISLSPSTKALPYAIADSPGKDDHNGGSELKWSVDDA
jgi:hypothetical protein